MACNRARGMRGCRAASSIPIILLLLLLLTEAWGEEALNQRINQIRLRSRGVNNTAAGVSVGKLEEGLAPEGVAVGPTPIQREPGCQFCHCKKVYLDVGSNIGVQIRKLFEPSRFPRAPVLRYFLEYFGEDRSDVCAVGFEPNPNWMPELKHIEETYRMMGYNVRFYTRTAVVAEDDGLAEFHLAPTGSNYRSMASSLIKNKRTTKMRTVVRTMNLARFIRENLSPNATVVMKMDIEGAEFTVFPQLLMSGVLCQFIDFAFIEWHDTNNYFKDSVGKGMFPGPDPSNPQQGWTSKHIMRFVQAMTAADPKCGVKISGMDDETFHGSGIAAKPLPQLVMPEQGGNT